MVQPNINAARAKALQQAVQLGIKYGPLAYEGLKRGRGPAQQFADRQLSKRNARAAAMEHAEHLLNGSVLPVYEGDTRVWVVFSGETPVGSHPTVRTPLSTLLEHYDLSKRIRPEDDRSNGSRAGVGGRRRPLQQLPQLPTRRGRSGNTDGTER